jgi:pimeloyl-ACP methyl ester carboxylesterase
MGVGVQELLYGRLSQLKTPAMFLAGEYDDKFRAIGLDMAGLIPHVLYCLIPHAGHAPFWEQPESCVRAVRPFLLGHDAPR